MLTHVRRSCRVVRIGGLVTRSQPLYSNTTAPRIVLMGKAIVSYTRLSLTKRRPLVFVVARS
jgi:hypothetical protein